VEEGRLEERDGGRCDSTWKQCEADERGEHPRDRRTPRGRTGNAAGMAHGDPSLGNVTRLNQKAVISDADANLNSIFRRLPVSFRAVARLADCSPDFRCRTPSLRARIAQLRAQPRRATASEPPARDESTSNVVRELAAQLAHEKRRRREAVAALQAALAAAHGELLALRHQLAVGQPRPAA
jgi:hypothetical protein